MLRVSSPQKAHVTGGSVQAELESGALCPQISNGSYGALLRERFNLDQLPSGSALDHKIATPLLAAQAAEANASGPQHPPYPAEVAEVLQLNRHLLPLNRAGCHAGLACHNWCWNAT